MKKQNSLKMIISHIYDYFISSNDYNGLPLSDLCCLLGANSIQEVIELVREETVQTISQSHDENPHIIRFGFVSKDEQIRTLQQYDGSETICLYPSTSYLEENRNVSDYELKPFEKMMALGHPQLKACYFRYDILLNYASDPRMNMKFNGYSGSIKSNGEVNESNYINLDTFGIGRQNDSFIVVSYPRDLKNMSTSNQFLWFSQQIVDNSDCKTIKNYQDNLFRGCWSFPNTVYRSILKEIHNINELTEIAFKKKLFNKNYSKDELVCFDILSFPSLEKYNEFLLLLEKVVISNINIHFFKQLIDPIDKSSKQKGALTCLKEWITKVNSDVVDDIFNPLYKARKERQAPAHKIEENKYSNEYLLKQHQICSEVYASLNLLRRLLQSHPKVKDHSIKYPNTQYIEI